jgi:hypothetical protein
MINSWIFLKNKELCPRMEHPQVAIVILACTRKYRQKDTFLEALGYTITIYICTLSIYEYTYNIG